MVSLPQSHRHFQYRHHFILRPCVLPAQIGQPVPCARLWTDACHSWPCAHFHQTFLWVCGVTSAGVNGAFFTASHCFANSGLNGGKVVAAGLDRFPSAIGAPCSRGAVIYRGLPGMSLPAVPPEFLFAAVAYGFRGQRRIPFVPLSQQLCISRMDAAVIEQFSHVG